MAAPSPDDSSPVGSFDEQKVHVRVLLKDSLPETKHRFKLVQKDGVYELEKCEEEKEKVEEVTENGGVVAK